MAGEQAKMGRSGGGTLRPGRARLLVVEGIDLSGRTTQVRLLHNWLVAQDYVVTQTALRESPLIADVLARARLGTPLQPLTYSLLFAADHIDRTQRVIRPALERGEIVLADRYTYTAIARDVARGLDLGWIENLYRYAVHPHMVFYLHIGPEEAVRRRMALLQQRTEGLRHNGGQHGKHSASDKSGKGDKKQRKEEKDVSYAPLLARDALDSFRNFEVKMYREYERMKQAYGFTVIEGSQSIEQVQGELRRAVMQLLLEE